MIERIEVRNYQSLYDVSLDMARFTVIVGPSSSGKSAFMRAIRTLASNTRGTSYISHGKEQASITARGEGWVVSLERGKSNAYRVVRDGAEETYTKLGGAVPEAVTSLLGIQPISDAGSPSCSDQFDRPYLVGETGQTVARVLGDLTNVSTIFEAVREANRRRQASSGVLKTRKTDIEELREQAQQFKGIKERQRVLQEAESVLENAKTMHARAAALERLIEEAEIAQVALAKTERLLPDLPSLEPALSALGRLNRLKELMIESQTQLNAAHAANTTARDLAVEESQVKDQIQHVLLKHGTCPTCGQEIG